MVAGALISLAVIGGVIIFFNEPIGRFLNKLTGETQEEIDKAKIRDERGALTNTGTFIFGEDFVNPETGKVTPLGKAQTATSIGLISPISGIILNLQNLFNLNKDAQNNAIDQQAKQTGQNSLDIDKQAVTVTKIGTVGKKGQSVFR